MEILITIVYLLVLNAAPCVTVTDDADRPCTRFEYEYRVIDTLVEQSNQLKKLLRANDEKDEIINRLQKDVLALKESRKASDGSVYTRWGRADCPDNGTELVYKGYGAGSAYTHAGGAANDLCLPEDPTWIEGRYTVASETNRAFVYGMEYETGSGTNQFLLNMHDDDVPCAVCRSNRPTMIMIPGRNECYDTWSLEYEGYLMARYWNQASASEFICLDKEPQALEGGKANHNGRLLYLVEPICGSLACPPYVKGRELGCVVCTK